MNHDMNTTCRWSRNGLSRAIFKESVGGLTGITTRSRHGGRFYLVCVSRAHGREASQVNRATFRTFSGLAQQTKETRTHLINIGLRLSPKGCHPAIGTQSRHFHDIGRRTPNFLNHGQDR